MFLVPLLVLSTQIDPSSNVAEGMEAFSHALVKAMPTRRGKNFVASPFSVASCLALLLPGVGKSDAKELSVALHLPSSASETFVGFKSLNAELTGRQGEFVIANSIWTAPGFHLAPGYVSTLQEIFGAEAGALRDTGSVGVKQVNDWIGKKTKGRIRNLLQQLGGATSAVLVNAVAFDGAWDHAFSASMTTKKPFHGPAGVEKVPMMAQVEATNYLQEKGFEAVELFYTHESFSLTILLPRVGIDPIDILKALDRDYMKLSRPAQVDLELPEFRFSSTFNLMGSLKALGIGSFASHLDARPMLDSPRAMNLSQLLHGAEIEVDEKGTRATAATIGGVTRAAIIAMPNKAVFHVDRPFAFILRHVGSGTPLFVGAVYDPSHS